MKITSIKPKGQRIFKSVTIHSKYEDGSKRRTKRPFWIEPVENGWWFDLNLGQWYDGGYDNTKHSISSYYSMTYHGFHNVYSLKAVKRLINKWDVPKGTKFRVNLPFKGFDFIIIK